MKQRIIAHAGCLGLPDATMAYMAGGLSAGADGFEVDLLGTRDGIGVLAHDPVVKDADGKDLDLSATDYAEAKARLPSLTTLDEALRYASEKRAHVNVDIKDLSIVPFAADRIRVFRCADLAYLTGIGIEDAGMVVKRNPGVRLFVNLRHNGRALGFTPLLGGRAARDTRMAKEVGCAGINVEWILCNRAWVDFAHGLGLPVSVWTVDDQRIMARAARWGADLLTTNEPGRLAETLAASGR